jgi:spore coat polysaccharide biosynthesis protein SpsF (cytidylyltransferase family)
LIEVRSTSTRFPGKCYEIVTEGFPLSHLVWRRVALSSCPTVAFVVPHDDPFTEWTALPTVEGLKDSVGDVMMELLHASTQLGLDHIVEITGDCPFVDPWDIDWVLREHLDMGNDFTAWMQLKGAEIRVFERASLEQAVEKVIDYRRNGSTIFYRDMGWRTEIMRRPLAKAIEGLDLSIDEPADMEFAKRVYEEVPWNASLSAVLGAVSSLLGIRKSGPDGAFAGTTSSPPPAPTSSPRSDPTTAGI